MPESLVSPQLLDDLIEGRLLAAPRMGEAASLARLAAECRQLTVPGPDALTAARMRRRYRAYLNGEHSRIGRWLSAWFGAGLIARPLRERLAGGLMVALAAGGSASYATGVTPDHAATRLGELAISIVVNLDPRDGVTGEFAFGPDLTLTPTPTSTPGASTPSAAASPPGGGQQATLPAGPVGAAADPTAAGSGSTTGTPLQATPPSAAPSTTVTPAQTAPQAGSTTPPSTRTATATFTPPAEGGTSATPPPAFAATPAPTATPAATPSLAATATPTVSPVPTNTSTATPSSTPTVTPTSKPGDVHEAEDD